MRKIIIGDIHGCFDELQALLNKLDFDSSKDQLYCVGDIVNKGPNSLACFELVLKYKAKVVLGNHELGFLAYLENKDLPHHPKFESLKKEFSGKLDSFISWAKALPLVIEEDEFLLVHAGLVPGVPWQKSPARLLCNIRTWDGEGKNIKSESNPPWYDFYKEPKIVVFGHWAYKGLVQGSNYIGLDSGCVYGKELSAVVFPGKQIHQVKAKKEYCPIK